MVIVEEIQMGRIYQGTVRDEYKRIGKVHKTVFVRIDAEVSNGPPRPGDEFHAHRMNWAASMVGRNLRPL